MVVQDCVSGLVLRELTASQLVAIATRSDTGSHNTLDLIQSLVPPHHACNGYISIMHQSFFPLFVPKILKSIVKVLNLLHLKKN